MLCQVASSAAGLPVGDGAAEGQFDVGVAEHEADEREVLEPR